MVDSSTDDAFAADAREAFALLGHEIRLDITLALLERWRAAHTEPQSYSELMRAVGMEDSGKFNYHLDRLRGVYVRQVDDGYVPTASATALYRAVLATRPTGEPDRSTVDVGELCPDCSNPLVGTYQGSFLTVECRECEQVTAGITYPFPQNGLDGRPDSELFEAVLQRASHHVSLARSGQCPFCVGTTTATIDLDSEGPVEITCDTCSFTVDVQFLFALRRVPAVSAALLELGIDAESARPWAVPTPERTVRRRDPLVVELRVAQRGTDTTVVVDGTLDVRSVTVDGESVRPAGDG